MTKRPHSTRWTTLVAAALIALLLAPAALSAGQSPQQRNPGRRGGELDDLMRDQLEQAPALYGATVSLVRVDVIVTGDDGSFITDLGPEDFEVYEDGERQEILNVQLVDLAAGEVHPLFGDETGGSAQADPPPGAEATPPGAGTTDRATDRAGADGTVSEGVPAADSAAADADGRARSAASDLGAVIFLIDGPSLNQQAKARFGDAWTDLLEQTDALQLPRAAYMVDNVGRVEELAPLGYDLEVMRAAAETVRESPFIGTSIRTRMFEIADDLTNEFVDLSHLAQAKARMFEADERNRALATYELLTSFADALWTRSGRTAVVWVSTGIKLMQGGPYTALFGNEPNATAEGMAGAAFDIYSPDPQIKSAQEALHRAANGSNVSFYTIDPSLLSETRQIGVDAEMRGAAGAQMLANPVVTQSLAGLRDSMRMAAAETGGRAYIQATDIEMILEEIEADTSRFYLISYEPPRNDGDGEYHEIRVEVLRDDADVRARGGYVDHSAADRVRRSIEAALILPGSVTDLPIEAETFRSRPVAESPNLLLAVAVDGGELGVAVGPGGERRVSIDIHTLVLDANGMVDEAHEQLAARSGPGGTFVSDPDNPLMPTLVGFMAYQHEWSLEPGDYTFNVAVLDNVTGRVGATSIDVEIPDPGEAWGVSDPLLVTIDAAGRPHPVVLGRVLEGQNLAVFVEVYGGEQPILSGQVFMETADDDNPEQGARLFPIPLRRVGTELHRGSLPLPTGMPPGRYFVQLAITDPWAEQHKIVRLPIEVVGPPAR